MNKYSHGSCALLNRGGGNGMGIHFTWKSFLGREEVRWIRVAGGRWGGPPLRIKNHYAP